MPFLGQRLGLPKPLPLGDRQLLAGWLPRQREAVQIIELDALLAAKRLSDVLPGSGACCHLPRRPALASAVDAGRRRDLAA